jgi:hypothetical protein
MAYQMLLWRLQQIFIATLHDAFSSFVLSYKFE